MKSLLVALALLLPGVPPMANARPALDTALITNSGSTNTAPYRILVRADGSAKISSSLEERSLRFPKELADDLFAALQDSRTAAQAPVRCMKSASFGYTLKVSWQGWTSPDLTCATRPTDAALENAVAAIIEALNVQTVRGALR